MTPEVIAILGVGTALAGLILGSTLPGFRELRQDVAAVQDRVGRFEAEMRERIAHLEGLIEGLIKKEKGEATNL